MSRRLSLNARTAHDASGSDEVEVVLIRITHPSLDAPLHLTTDPTERLSIEPLMYGTRSTWGGADPATEPHLFILASAQLPDETEDAPAQAVIVLECVDQDMAAPLRSTTKRATVDLAVVLASSPDIVEYEVTGLQLISADGDASEIRLTVSHQPIVQEPFPARRMTKAAFPGLHR